MFVLSEVNERMKSVQDEHRAQLEKYVTAAYMCSLSSTFLAGWICCLQIFGAGFWHRRNRNSPFCSRTSPSSIVFRSWRLDCRSWAGNTRPCRLSTHDKASESGKKIVMSLTAMPVVKSSPSMSERLVMREAFFVLFIRWSRFHLHLAFLCFRELKLNTLQIKLYIMYTSFSALRGFMDKAKILIAKGGIIHELKASKLSTQDSWLSRCT